MEGRAKIGKKQKDRMGKDEKKERRNKKHKWGKEVSQRRQEEEEGKREKREGDRDAFSQLESYIGTVELAI